VFYDQTFVPHENLRLTNQFRFGILHADGFGSRTQVQDQLGFGYRETLYGNIDVLFGISGGGQKKFAVDALRADLSARLMKIYRITVSGRLLENQFAEITELVPQGSRRADATMAYEGFENMSIQLVSGVADEIGDSRRRMYAGPVVQHTRLFGPSGGLTAGYQEELGWISGRSIYVQPDLSFLRDRLNFLSRVSFSQNNEDDGSVLKEYGIFGSVGYRFLSWLTGRISLHSRFGDGPLGFLGNFTLTGSL
jgi:hypothetical protein